jgi:hypothetical protein
MEQATETKDYAAEAYYPVQPVPFTNVKIADEFWSPRLETNRTVTIPYDFKKCEETHRIRNFEVAAGLTEAPFEGIRFNDSDVFKVIEGASYSLHLHPDPELEAYLDEVIAKIATAQEEDGYLFTTRTIAEKHGPENLAEGAGETRWSYLKQSHELYNLGHMYEAAVAHYRATGKRTFLDIAIKSADLLAQVFGPDKRRDVPGHQEIEIGLAKLYRVTGEESYLKLAKFFLDERGQADGHSLYGPYAQDHAPVIEQDEAVGHAVRAGYMYAGMADVAALTGDAAYIEAIDRIWQNVVTKKLYVTGGIGARHKGEAFGDAYELPNLTAYNETCAAIANILWNQRLFLLHGDAKYIDVLERTLYNGFLSGIAMSGDAFFYPNPLESDGSHERSPWFHCSCCPTNVVRFLPSLSGYVYAQRNDAVYVNLFISGAGTINIRDATLRLEQATSYPWNGKSQLTITPDAPTPFTLYVRIPGWAQGQPVPSDLYRYMNPKTSAAAVADEVVLKVNGEAIPLEMDKGFARIRRTWQPGDEVTLSLPMPVRRVLSHAKVEADASKVALERGPLVYCAEWPDHDVSVLDLIVPDDAELIPKYQEDLLGGVIAIQGTVSAKTDSEDSEVSTELKAIPYYAWAHRGRGEMSVWLKRK